MGVPVMETLRRVWRMYRPKEHGLTVMTLQVVVLGAAFAVERALPFWLGVGLVLIAPFLREVQRQFLYRGDNTPDFLSSYALAGGLIGPLALLRPDRVPLIWLLIFVLIADLGFHANRVARTWYAETFGVVGLMAFLALVLSLGGLGWPAILRVVVGFWAVGTLAVLAVRYQRIRREAGHASPWPMIAFSVGGSGVGWLILPAEAAGFLTFMLVLKTILTLWWLPVPRTRRDFRRLGWTETLLTGVFLVGWIALKPALITG